jgi:hypothetical protein
MQVTELGSHCSAVSVLAVRQDFYGERKVILLRRIQMKERKESILQHLGFSMRPDRWLGRVTSPFYTLPIPVTTFADQTQL